jgi:ankyrin repeat protein
MYVPVNNGATEDNNMDSLPVNNGATEDNNMDSLPVNNGATEDNKVCEENEMIDIIDLLLNKPLLEKNNDGDTPLHILIKTAKNDDAYIAPQIGYLLLKNNTKCIDIQNNDGNTPLHIAVIENKLPMVKLLIANNADINIQNNKNYTVKFLSQSDDVDSEITKMILPNNSNIKTIYKKYNKKLK